MPDSSAPTSLYRLYGADGALLYVGISTRPFQRVREHSKGQTWWTEVASQTFEHFPTREEAAAAELDAIRTENPQHNIAGRERPWRVHVDLPPGPPRLAPAGARALLLILAGAKAKDDDERYLRLRERLEALDVEEDGRRQRAAARAQFPELVGPPQAPGYSMDVSPEHGCSIHTPTTNAVPPDEVGLDAEDYPDVCELCVDRGRVEIVHPHLARPCDDGKWVRVIYRCELHCRTWVGWRTPKFSVSA